MPVEEEKKLTRKQKKDAKLGQQISSEAKGFGVDVDNPIVPIGPVGSAKKAEIDKKLQDYAKEDLRGDLKKFQALKKGPESTSPAALDKERLKRSLRREKRARFGDILTTFGRSFQRKDFDRNLLQAPKIRKQRQALYEQFKGASQGSKKRLSEWESKYVDEQLDYLDSKLKDNRVSELEKNKIRQIQARIKNTQADTARKRTGTSSKVKPTYTHQTKDGSWNLTNQKKPYSDLYYKLTGNSPTLINELAKISGHATDKAGALKRNLSSDEIERFSNTLLSKAFDLQVDANGNQIAIPKAGKEQFLQNITSAIDETNSLRTQLQEMQDKRDSELYNVTGWFQESKKEEINNKYNKIIEDMKVQLNESESGLSSLLEGDNASTTRRTPPQEDNQADNTTTPKTDFMNIVNQYK